MPHDTPNDFFCFRNFDVMAGARCSSLILSGRRLDYITRVQLEFGENSGTFRLTLSENRLGLGSWPYLVKRGRLEVSQRFPVYRKAGKTAPLMRESLPFPLVEVPVLSTSPNLAKSQDYMRRT
jgi:hypothetical protein